MEFNIEKDTSRRYDDVMTVRDVMDYLAVGKNTVYELIKNKEIRSFRIGRIHKILKDSVEAYTRKLCCCNK